MRTDTRRPSHPPGPPAVRKRRPAHATFAVTVRRRHLEQGTRRSSTACAIALALDEVFPGGGGLPDAGGAGWYVTEGQITLWWREPAGVPAGGEGAWRRRVLVARRRSPGQRLRPGAGGGPRRPSAGRARRHPDPRAGAGGPLRWRPPAPPTRPTIPAPSSERGRPSPPSRTPSTGGCARRDSAPVPVGHGRSGRRVPVGLAPAAGGGGAGVPRGGAARRPTCWRCCGSDWRRPGKAGEAPSAGLGTRWSGWRPPEAVTRQDDSDAVPVTDGGDEG